MFNVNTVGSFPPFCLFFIVFIWRPLMLSCLQQLMILSRDKSVKLAQLYSRVDWIRKYCASLGVRLGEANA